MDLSKGVGLLDELPIKAKGIEGNEALAHFLSDFALLFASGLELSASQPTDQAGFWLFLPFATMADFPACTQDQAYELSIASTLAIIYNILIDKVLDDPGQPDVNAQVLADSTLARLHHQLYTLFPAESLFWNNYRPLYERFLWSMLEERIKHKDRPQPYAYSDFTRLAQGKMSMALLNPVGQAILNGTPERIPPLQAAWDELNIAVVIMDDIADWKEDFRQGNFTYLLAEALQIEQEGQPLPHDEQTLVTRVVFSGAMEILYRKGADHLDRAAELAIQASAPALASLATQRAQMFRKYSKQLFLRKLTALQEHLPGSTMVLAKNKEELL